MKKLNNSWRKIISPFSMKEYYFSKEKLKNEVDRLQKKINYIEKTIFTTENPVFINVANSWFRTKNIIQINYEENKYETEQKSQITFYLEAGTQILSTPLTIENEVAKKLVKDLNEDLPGVSYLIEENPVELAEPEIKEVEEIYIDELGNQVIKKIHVGMDKDDKGTE